MNETKLFKWLGLVVLIPLAFLFFTNDHFRYPCQNPDNWNKDFCQRPQCDVTRSCPDHIFKGQRDPRTGPSDQPTPTPQGVVCAK